jgi:hypothetical protein
MSRDRSTSHTAVLTTQPSCYTAKSPRAALARLQAEHRMLVARGAIVDAVRATVLEGLYSAEVGQ